MPSFTIPLTPAQRDRARGALLGLAVGDALGTTLEFSRRDSRPRHTEMTGGGPFDLPAGAWTDDTSMALALAESLLAQGGLAPLDLMQRFLAWWRDGAYSCTGTCFDIGNVTAKALGQFERVGDPIAGPIAENTAGNGSLMRVAPAALFALGNRVEAMCIAREQSRTTHGAPQALDACAFFTGLLVDAVVDGRKPTPRPFGGHAAVNAVAAGSYLGLSRDAVSSSGYVIDTLQAALWAWSETTTFEDALVLAVNLGDDADTVGAVTGQIAGAMYGASAIPARWLERLAWRESIEALTDRLTGNAGIMAQA
jgi:ADP-ribosyl-[dinitrogen reductase] hydrolase